jgi:hypothetical protein
MQSFSSDVLAVITKELPISTFVILVQSNKQIYNLRHEFVHFNEKILQFQKQANMSYHYAIHNSHIAPMCDLDDIQLHLSDTDKKKVYNTCKLLSCCINTDKIIDYLQEFMRIKYNDKIQSIYTDIVCIDNWCSCNIPLIDLYEIVHFCQKRKYRQLHECLLSIQMDCNISNMHSTFQFMLRFVELSRSKAIKTCFIYVIYTFIHTHMDYIVYDMTYKPVIQIIITKSYEFIEHIHKMKILPNYLKNLLIYQISQTRELLINNRHIWYIQGS